MTEKLRDLTAEDREWIDARADHLFRDSERQRGGIRPATIMPQDFRDYFVAQAAWERAALAAAPQPAPAPAADEREAMIRAMHMTADSSPLDRSLFDTIADALLAAGYRKADPLADERARGFSPTHQHKKRGTAYELIGAACIQSDEPLEDMAVVEVYVGSDGDLWARRQSEFHDGRFEAIREADA